MSHVRLKDGVDLEDDYAAFARQVRASLLSWVLTDSEKRVRGMAHFQGALREHEGRRFITLNVEFVFVDPEYRQGLGYLLAALRALIRARQRWPNLPMYLFSAAYPSGFLLATMMTEPVWLWGESGIPAWEDGAFRRLVERSVSEGLRGWDPRTGWLQMRTLPLDPRRDPPRDERLRSYWSRYQAICPRWAEGYNAFFFAPYGWSAVWVGARSAVHRISRKIRRRRS